LKISEYKQNIFCLKNKQTNKKPKNSIKKVAEQNGITGYPWVAAFYNGKKVEDMAGLGGADSIGKR
jgi:hypothetical protein